MDRRDGAVTTRLASGKEIRSDSVLYAIGRQGSTAGLGLENVGLEADKRGRIPVDRDYRTTVPTSSRSATSAGRRGWPPRRWSRAASPRCTPSASPCDLVPELVPTGVYSIPEIGMVGRTEEELTQAAVPYVAGIVALGRARARRHDRRRDRDAQAARVDEDRRMLGVHAIGTAATELVHIGQAVMGGGASVDFLVGGGLQLPDVRRVLQGRGAGRRQPPALTRGGPVVRRTTSSSSSSCSSGPLSLPRMASTSRSTPCRPLSSSGWRTVVRPT